MFKKRVYLDTAAGLSANASSPHAEGRAARGDLEAARVTIARLVECKSDDVIFTSGATEANALAILGAARAARAAGLAHPHLLYLPSAHASVVENMKLAAAEGAVIEELPINPPAGGCRVDCAALAVMLRPETVLISMDAVCGETGVVWNTREVGQVVSTARQKQQNFAPSVPVTSRRNSAVSVGPLLHVDASQAGWSEKLARAHFAADLMTLDASKVSEARGIGCLIASRALALAPLYGGGGQERGLRPGSEAPGLASAFAEGLARAGAARGEFRAAATAARRMLIERISGISKLVVNESREQAPHILNISLLGRDTDYALALLDEAGFALSTKSACESSSGTGSRAVEALWGSSERAASTLRISWSPMVKRQELMRFATALINVIAFIDSTAGE